jgi:glycosyltransferase involved in cell wall biosynthesis
VNGTRPPQSALPRISVVTPSLNQEAFIEATLRSVISQGYPELEYTVVDGGSSDRSVEIIRRYEASLSSWTSEPDAGHADAVNQGFARTSGEIMCWINSSDVQYPWTLATVGRIFADLPQVEWLMGIPTKVGSADAPVSVRAGYVNEYDLLAGYYRAIQQESVFWRRRLWERAGGALDVNFPRAADFELWLRFFRLAPLYHAETILGGFRTHEDRLGDVDRGLYQREAEECLRRFAGEQDRRTLRRARLVRAVGPGRRKVVGQALHRAGLWPWYAHPRIVFDFDRDRWTTRP